MYKNFFKRLLDFTVALIVFLVLSPIFLFTCILLIIVNNGKPFFIQIRPGLKEKPFDIIKFKIVNWKTGTCLIENCILTFKLMILKST
jgi:lipopolysaccharide/colanic/teichoic acid biosynthesis glycosyltransferase